ncbi:Putative ABC transport system ATP-binding protein [Pseudoalteromonas luteoviolacea B = ATCC 29581]|nr:Putative ABC transport system ATP-binding protein [Pseudoalteromonas luteoviolacea B = ATCC 29581]
MTSTLIQVNDLHFFRADNPILQGLNLTIKQGECIAILGPNGAGKSTFIDLLLGRLKPASGNIQIMDKPAGAIELKAHQGVMLQTATLPGHTLVKEFIALFRSYYRSPLDMEQAWRLCGLHEQGAQRFNQLSGGQKQRLLFTLALIGNPELVFLDEPSLAMDASMRREMWSLIDDLKTKGKTIILTTHYLDEADRLADRVMILKEGKFIATGTPKELKRQGNRVKVEFISLTPKEILASLLDGVHPQFEDNVVSFTHSSPESILKRLFLAGVDIQALSVTPHSLEDTFLQLTQGAAA